MPITAADTKSEWHDFEREVRFAVVIYGGVSLAIYINGVVQELLGMVRSTSTLRNAELSRTEKVYRELASMVGDSGIVRSEERPSEPGKVGLTAKTMDHLKRKTSESAPQVTTRFVVDILCGTSAGGINAVYLAKALANGTTMRSLAKMWIRDADLNKLLNDGEVRPRFLQDKTPSSLLNSRWMYLKLLEALQAMDTENPRGAMVEDLDLYCTTTDLDGLPIDLPLTDKSVQERRYKSEFLYKRRVAGARDDFDPQMNPFLAFTARCTSSFPVAFEPMMLEDIVPTLLNEGKFEQYFLLPGESPRWNTPEIFGAASPAGRLRYADKFERTCSIYSGKVAAEQVPFNRRAFADGGYLHNKPFSYSIETIKSRSSTLPVDRKLLYIEPEPESFSRESTRVSAGKDGVPVRQNAIQNSADALIVLPRYQTIQQDIDCVVEWNSNIGRVQRLIQDLSDDVDRYAADPQKIRSWRESIALVAYTKVRRSAAADQVASRIADAMNVSLRSSEGTAIRMIVGKWRDDSYPDQAGREAGPDGLGDRFLLRFDFDFCGRAIRFLRTYYQDPKRIADSRDKLGDLADLNREFQALSNKEVPLELDPLVYSSWLAFLRFIVDPEAAKLVLLDQDEIERHNLLLSATDAGAEARVRFVYRPETYPISFLLDPGVAAAVLGSIGVARPSSTFFAPTREAVLERAGWWQTKPTPAGLTETLERISFASIRAFVVEQFNTAYSSASSSVSLLEELLESLRTYFFHVPDDGTGPAWTRFLIQDSLIYPIIFGTPVGEFETVDLFRISPRDTAVLAGTDPGESGTRNPALKGSSLGAFGGFVDRRWRLNDMLRGRLDGAERLITAVLPDSDPNTVAVREDLIRKAQEAIAEEWIEFEAEFDPLPADAEDRPAKISSLAGGRR